MWHCFTPELLLWATAAISNRCSNPAGVTASLVHACCGGARAVLLEGLFGSVQQLHCTSATARRPLNGRDDSPAALPACAALRHHEDGHAQRLPVHDGTRAVTRTGEGPADGGASK